MVIDLRGAFSPHKATVSIQPSVPPILRILHLLIWLPCARFDVFFGSFIQLLVSPPSSVSGFFLMAPKPPHSLQTSKRPESAGNLPFPLQTGQKAILYFPGLSAFAILTFYFFLSLVFGSRPILINCRFSKMTWSTISPQITHFHPQKCSWGP